MNRQHAKPSGGESNEASPLSLLVHAADAQHQRPAGKRPSNGSTGSRGKSHPASGSNNGTMRRDLQESAMEEQMMQRQVAAARAEAAFQQHQGLLSHLPRGLEAELYQQSALAAAAQQQQQNAAAMAIATDLRSALAAAQLRQAAQFQNHDFLLARAAQQQLGGFGGGLDQLQELELQRLEELERRHILAQAASGHAPQRLASPALAARQLEMQEAQLRQEQLERQLQQDAILDRVGGRGASEGLSQVRSAPTDASTGTASDNNKDSFQKTPGSVVVPCRARGMPMDHNFKTAYFVIPENVEHGEELICSYFACRNAGIKFRYCTYCKVPVAKRNFRKRHKHGNSSTAADGDDDSHSGDEMATAAVATPGNRAQPDYTESAVPKEISNSNAIIKESGAPPKVSDKPLPVGSELAAKNTPGETAASSSRKASLDEVAEKRNCLKVSTPQNEEASSKKDTKGKKESLEVPPSNQNGSKIDAEREHRWATLLSKRPPTKDGSAMSVWLMEVLAVSDLETPLSDKLPVGPPKSTSIGGSSETDRSKLTEASSKKEDVIPLSQSQGVLVKKKRPLAGIIHKNNETGNTSKSAAVPPEREGGGGFAEWRDRKKQKTLMKKGLSG